MRKIFKKRINGKLRYFALCSICNQVRELSITAYSNIKSGINSGKCKPCSLKGQVFTKERLEKMSNTQKGRVSNNKGKKFPQYSGKNHPNWKGGKSFELYGIEFNKDLKEKIRKRDNYTCQECGYSQEQLNYKPHVHHIDYNKQNNLAENLISLCRSCHTKTNFKRKDWTSYYQDKLGSTKNKTPDFYA